MNQVHFHWETEENVPEHMIGKENDCCLWKKNLEMCNPTQTLKECLSTMSHLSHLKTSQCRMAFSWNGVDYEMVTSVASSDRWSARNLFSHGFDNWQSKIKVPAGAVFGEGLQTAIFSLSLQCFFPCVQEGRGREGEKEAHRGTVASMLGIWTCCPFLLQGH